jgi:hypothetical protein
MPSFVPGVQLSRVFFEEAVLPIVRVVVPNLKFAAALIGSGSEVLDFDDEMSSDHHWGPRVMLFVNQTDISSKPAIDTALRDRLPTSFMGYSTNFSSPNPDDNNVQKLVEVETGPINHRVDIFTIREYLLAYLNFDVEGEIAAADWLTFPEQKLRSLSSQNIFHDEIGLREVLDRFKYFPRDVWLYLLASGWNRIGQEEHLMGRAGMAGDDIGSALIASRLVRDIMRLCFLMERTYAPYPKWFGKAFLELKCGADLSPHLETVLRSTGWRERESHLVGAYELVASMHNELGITDERPAKAEGFFGRPFKVIELVGGFSKSIVSRISDPEVRRIVEKGLIGGIDQVSDNTYLLSNAKKRVILRGLYES